MYIGPGRGRQSTWDKILMTTERPFLFAPCCKFQNDLFEILILYTFFNYLIHVYSPRAKTDKPFGVKILMSTESSYHFDHLFKFKKNLFEF